MAAVEQGFNAGLLLTKARSILSYLKFSQAQILEDITQEENHLSFLEASATQLKQNRRLLRNHILQDLMVKFPKERDCSARSSMANERIKNFVRPSTEPAQQAAVFQAATSPSPSYVDLSTSVGIQSVPNPKRPSELSNQSTENRTLTEIQMFDLVMHDWKNRAGIKIQKPSRELNLYCSTQAIKSELISGGSVRNSKTQIALDTKNFFVQEVDKVIKHESNRIEAPAVVHRRMNSPKGTSKLVEILNQIGKAKEGLLQVGHINNENLRNPRSPESKAGSFLSQTKVPQAARPSHGDARSRYIGIEVEKSYFESRTSKGENLQVLPAKKSQLAQQSPSISINITQYGVGAARSGVVSRHNGSGMAKVRSLEAYNMLDSKKPVAENAFQANSRQLPSSQIQTPKKQSKTDLSEL